jgi:hypothetical protein
MNAKAWTANLFLVGLLVLVVGAPYAAAGDDPKTTTTAAAAGKAPEMSADVKLLGTLENLPEPPDGWFKRDPDYKNELYDADAQLNIYNGKYMNKTAQPLLSQGIRLYDRGAYTPRPTWLGEQNPINFVFLSYGDFRTAVADYDNGTGKQQSQIAARLNLDFDLAITATERIHAFVRPLDKNGSFTHYQLSGGTGDKFVHDFNTDIKTLFFEGDATAIRQGLTGTRAGFDLPITLGRVPLFTQNGIWLDDAVDGGAFSITARSSHSLDVSNYDLTFFAGLGNVTTGAAPGKDNKVFGMAGFADLRGGYAEWGYGFLKADSNSDLSYSNVTAAFSKRYRLGDAGVANSVRLIGNFGQSAATKTADGVLVLVENSFFKSDPSFLVPYMNFFAGFKNPQPLARAGDSGGVLKNTGINFESDGLTGYPTLDARAQDSWGAAAGLEKLWGVSQQLVVEGAVVERMGSSTLKSQYALGVRFQHPINNAWIFRADTMHGWLQGQKDVYGIRLELRRKF